MTTLSDVLTTSPATLANATHPIDVIVIGSGTAGVTTAIELAHQGHAVVILEAGPFVLPSHVGSTPFRSRADLVPQIQDLVRHRSIWTNPDAEDDTGQSPRNNDAWSAVGGRTLFWGGCTPRFTQWDFDDWPLSYDDFAPYYDRAENLMHVSGAGDPRPPFFRGEEQSQMLQRLHDAGIEAVHAPLGVDTQEAKNGYIPRGFDSSVARLTRSGLLTHEVQPGHIVLVSDTAVRQIEQDGTQVTGVIVRGAEDKHDTHLTARQYCLAGGAIQSTRLAVASGLRDLNPMVGRHIADHLFIQGLFKLKEPVGAPLYTFIPSTADRRFNIQIQGPFDETWYSPYHATVWLDCNPDGLYLLAYCFGVGEATEGNELQLLDSAEDPHADLWQYKVQNDRTDRDRATLDDMAAFLPQVAQGMGAELVRSQVNHPGSALHEIGGLRMSANPDAGVTDSHGRFWALSNLSVADSAAWPSQGGANSYLTITAWSLRHAEGVAARLSGAS